MYPHQDDALIEVVSGANVILSAPTGSGKCLRFPEGAATSLARVLRPAENARGFQLCAA